MAWIAKKVRARGCLVKAVLIIFGVALALIVSELAARLIFPTTQMLFVPDPVVGFRHAPNQRVWWTNECREFGVWFTTNAHGEPDIERSIDKPEGVYRVAIIGDSIVEAAQVRREDRFTSILERWLNEWIQMYPSSIQQVEVLVFGTTSYGTAQEWLYYKSYVRRYSPDVVLLVFLPANDIRNNSFQLEVVQAGRPEIMPFFYLDDSGELVLKDREFYANAVAAYSRLPSDTGFRGAYRWLRDRVRLVQILDRARVRAPALLAPSSLSAQWKVDADLYNPWVQQTRDEWQQAWRITAAILDQFAKDVRNDGAEFHVAIASGPLEVNEETRNIVFQGARMSGYDWQLANRLADAMLARLGLSYTNLLPAIEAATHANIEPMHFVCDGHLSPAGHYVVATELLPVLKSYLSKWIRDHRSGLR